MISGNILSLVFQFVNRIFNENLPFSKLWKFDAFKAVISIFLVSFRNMNYNITNHNNKEYDYGYY